MTQTERTINYLDKHTELQERAQKQQEDENETMYLQKSRAYDAYKYTKDEQYY